MIRFDELFDRYVDGVLTPSEREEFLRLLQEPSMRARFVELVTFEAAVTDELRVALEPKLEIVEPPAVRASSRTLSKVQVRRSAPRSGSAKDWPFVLIIAASVLVVVGLIALMSGGREEAPRRAPPAPVVVAPTPTRALESMRPSPPPQVPRREVTLAPPELVLPKPAPAPSPDLVVPKPPSPTIKPPPAPASAPPPEPTRESATFIARLDRVQGDVRVGGAPAASVKGLLAGQGVTTGPNGYASIRFEDGTRIELGADTVVSRLAEGAKAVVVDVGLVAVDAVKQPRPMVVAAPHAEATVLGTEFTVYVTAAFSRLDVKEGRVKFTRLPQGIASVTAGAGQHVIAGAGYEFATRSGTAGWKPPTSLVLWLRADAAVKVGDGQVNAWGDVSPFGNHAAGLPGQGPTFVPDALKGRPALRFDGAKDHLVLPPGFSDFRMGLSAFVMARPAPGNTGSRLIDLGPGPQCDNIVLGRRDAADELGFWAYSNHQTKGKVLAPGTVVADQAQTLSAVMMPGGRATVYRNGVAAAAGQTSQPALTLRKTNLIGKSTMVGEPLFRGDLFEVLLFARGLTEPERAYVEAYLATKYADATAPPPLAVGSAK